MQEMRFRLKKNMLSAVQGALARAVLAYGGSYDAGS